MRYLTLVGFLFLFVSNLFAQSDSTAYNNMGKSASDPATEEVLFDPVTNQYIVTKKVGDQIVGTEYLSAEEYRQRKLNNNTKDYWKQKEADRAKGADNNSLIPKINIPNEAFRNIFGSNKIEIRPQGTAEIIMGVRVNKTQNPMIPKQQQTVTMFNFDQNIQINLLAKIGDKINFNANFNTKAVFNFENQMKLAYEGKEDDILQLLEFGNVNLPLKTTLIQGSQSIFGAKTKLKFGKFEITLLYGQERGEKKNISVKGGALVSEFELSAANYEANRHYFVGDYFKNMYDRANSTLPFVSSPTYITRMEVWVTNRINATENVRNIVGIMELGENLPNTNAYPNNVGSTYDPKSLSPAIRDVNSQYLYNVLTNGVQIEKLNSARLLSPNEYTFDPYLGFISLNQSLNADEVLAVAYQYTVGGQTFQVGEFGTDISAPDALVLKLLKSTNLDVTQANWDWMMKNIYSIGGYNIGPEDFRLDILYQDTETGVKVNYFPNAPGVSGTPLLQLFNLDRLNAQNDQDPDGFFDFVEGKTIVARNGRIIFPVQQPFSKTYLREVFTKANQNNPNVNIDELVERYEFDTLYHTIQQQAELMKEKNRYYMGGSYKGSSGSEISLGAFNVPQGSVTVTAGGVALVENVDYSVDYMSGRVTILNQSVLSSGLPVNISLENSATFNIQQKSLFGTRLDYKFNKNFQIGGTLMNLKERPLTQKIDMGNEPINNTIWGFDFNYSKEVPLITRIVDKIPGINTKAPSLVTLNGEFAHLIPGFNKVIDRNGENGVAYIDDFEGAETPIDVRNPFFWKLGSVPLENPMFPNGHYFNDLRHNFNRAKVTWFTQDPLFYRNNSLTPSALTNNPFIMANNYLREVAITEVFPGFQISSYSTTGPVINTQQILDIHFYPNERGPYNYDINSIDETDTNQVTLKNPKSNFASMMRKMETTNWDAANISYIEFWMMDPFSADDLNELKQWDDGPNAINQNTVPGSHQGGDFLIHIGNISEDILRDGYLQCENGLPTDSNNAKTITTAWGRAPLTQPITQNFDNNPDNRALQDVGLDGLIDTAEQTHFQSYLAALELKYNAAGNQDFFQRALMSDPSGDNFKNYTGSSYNNDVLYKGAYPHQRYKNFINSENNSPVSGLDDSYGQMPNTEDVNLNFTLDRSEAYYQYSVSLRPNDLQTIGQNYITDILEVPAKAVGNSGASSKPIRWIQFRVPIRSEDKEQFGSINDFRSIRFMRLVAANFPDDIFLRLATLQLVRADWRTYEQTIAEQDQIGADGGTFSVTTVNVEENSGPKSATANNSNSEYFRYALPPGVTREIDPANPQLTQLNEQSLVFNVHDLKDGLSKAVYKSTDFDFMAYKKLKMFVHAGQIQDNPMPIDSNDLTVFVRLGMDGSENYYEMEVPLKLSNPNIKPTKNPPSEDPVYQRNVWPKENELDIDLTQLPDLKLERDKVGAQQNLAYHKMTPDGKRITVVGNPNLANVRIVMIGVRNPHQNNNPWQDGTNGNKKDDALPKSVQVWVNELRVTDFYQSGGWAGKVRGQVTLADFGQVSLAVGTTRFGFGNIEQKPLERSRSNDYSIDFTTSFEFGKFFGQKAGVTIPIFFGYTNAVSNPFYNPLDPDVKLRDALSILQTSAQKDSLRSMTQTVTTRKSFNVTNMRKNRTNSTKKPKIWDIENFDVSYSYIDEQYRDTKTEKNNYFQHKASIGYTFMPQAKYWEPFKKSKKLKSKWAGLLRDFNFTWSPKRLSARATIDNNERELLLRNTTRYELLINPTFRKNFTWVRTYEFQYNPFKSLSLSFNAINNSRIDQDMHLDSSVAPRVDFFGRNTQYSHNFDVTYNIPFNKLPLTDWLTATVGYTGSFRWTTASLERNPDGSYTLGRYGNIAQNQATFKVNTTANLQTIYNKIPWVKDFDKPKRPAPKKPAPRPQDPNNPTPPAKEDEKKVKIVKWEKGNINFKSGRRKLIIHKLKTEDVTIKVTDNAGKEYKGELEIVDNKKVRWIPSEDIKGGNIYIEGRKEKKEFPWKKIPEVIVRLVLGVKNISVNYTDANGTILPGYAPTTQFLGMDFNQSSVGPDFVFGRQFTRMDLQKHVVRDSWMVRDSSLNVLFMQTKNTNLSATAMYEPFKGFRVTLTANRTFAENFQSNYRYSAVEGSPGDYAFQVQNPLSMGNFSMSYLPIGTSFNNFGVNPVNMAANRTLFDRLLMNRSIASNRLATLNPDESTINPGAAYQSGYGRTQQDVLLYSFLAAYSGRDVNSMGYDMFPQIPLPNWKVQFDGFKNIPFIKKIMKNFVISHGYQSTLNIAGYQSNYVYNNYDPMLFINNPNYAKERDDDGNFISQYYLSSVNIVESFNPLIKLDMVFNNSLTTAFEIKSSRNISLNFPNAQVTENNTFEVIIGAGYTIRELKMPFAFQGKQIIGNLNIRADVGIRDNSTVIRRIEEETQQVSAGQRSITIKVFAEYGLSRTIAVRVFVDQIINQPAVATSYPTMNTNAGLSLRITLTQ